MPKESTILQLLNKFRSSNFLESRQLQTEFVKLAEELVLLETTLNLQRTADTREFKSEIHELKIQHNESLSLVVEISSALKRQLQMQTEMAEQFQRLQERNDELEKRLTALESTL